MAFSSTIVEVIYHDLICIVYIIYNERIDPSILYVYLTKQKSILYIRIGNVLFLLPNNHTQKRLYIIRSL